MPVAIWVDVGKSLILTPVSRIVGGQPAAQHAWPWQVGLVSRQKTTSPNTTAPFCGGSLVSRAAVVTAAHCEQRVARFLVVVGDHDLATMDQGQRSIEPETWVSHPNYDARCHEICIAVTMSQPRLLHQVALTLLSPLACTSPPSLYREDMLTERMVCAASPGKDSCQVGTLLL